MTTLKFLRKGTSTYLVAIILVTSSAITITRHPMKRTTIQTHTYQPTTLQAVHRPRPVRIWPPRRKYHPCSLQLKQDRRQQVQPTRLQACQRSQPRPQLLQQPP